MGHLQTLPSRLHHTAYVTKDMEATRHFYEDILGLPLTATWCESDMLFGKERTYCHCFFGIGDGGALAFFQFARKEDEELFVPDMPATPFVHLALNVDQETQKEIEQRITAAGLEGDLCAGTRLLPVGLCGRSQRHDGGIHLRRSAGIGRRCRTPGPRPCRTEAVAGRRSHLQQHLPG